VNQESLNVMRVENADIQELWGDFMRAIKDFHGL